MPSNEPSSWQIKDNLTPGELPDYLKDEFTDLVKKGVKARRSLEEIKDEYIAEILERSRRK